METRMPSNVRRSLPYRSRSAGALGLVALLLFAAASEASFIVPSAVLTPGGPSVGVPLTSAAAGTLLASLLSPFSFATTAGTTKGTILSAVYLNPSGSLDFYYQVANDPTSVTALARVTADSFTGFATAVAFRLDGASLPGAGFVNGTPGIIPVTADRDASGTTVGFNFIPLPPGTKIPPGTTSAVLVISTNAINFAAGNFTVIDGGTQTVAAFQPAGLIPPTINKIFNPSGISLGGASTLTFTISNPNAGVSMTNISFTDTLPVIVTIATPNGLTGSCGGGTITAVEGTSVVMLAGAALGVSASCTFSINVTGVSPGSLTNTTGSITGTAAATPLIGGTASAPITVAPVIAAQGLYQLRYLANLQIADSYINATNAGTVDGFDPNGRICANFYVFDPREELVSCCSCLITPNGLVSLSARNDLINNTLTGAPLTNGITVKVLASFPTPVGGTTCNASTPTAATLVNGLKLWAVTPHGNTGLAPPPPAASAFQLGETEFASSELSLNELSKLTGFCRFIQVVASNFGICRSCPTVGAQGASIK